MSNLSDVFTGIFDWAVKDKIFHDGAFLGSGFQNGEVITSTTASGKIIYVGIDHIKYILNGIVQFQVNETITGATSGTTCIVKKLNTFHTSVTNRIYFQEAEEKQLPILLPYATFSFMGETPIYEYKGELTTIGIKWTIFSDASSSMDLVSILDKLELLFNKAKLIISGWGVQSCVKQNTGAIMRDENKVWSISTLYTIKIQK